jgi:hypothetical protein
MTTPPHAVGLTVLAVTRMIHWTSWVVYISLGVYVISLLFPLGLRSARLRWARDGFVIIIFMMVLKLMQHPRAETVAGLALIAGSVWYVERTNRAETRMRTAWLRRLREIGEITVAAPFRGRWKALGCGPDAAKNHHLVVPEQWFAVDWVRVDGDSMGSEILSPVDGMVAHTEDGHVDIAPARWLRRPSRRAPAGNYVAIEVAADGLRASREVASVYVLLCHLKQGSVRVNVGQSIRAGEAIGLCGNSGNTTVPHLHMHAQDHAKIAFGWTKGVPMRFREAQDAEWIRPGTVVEA